MPRRSKGPRLYWRTQKDRGGVWEIRDTGNVRISTRTDSRPEAEAQLSEYIEQKHRPSGPTSAEELTIARALTIYAEERGPELADPDRAAYAIEALDDFWRDLKVSAISGATCRRYVAERGASSSTARRELGVLQAALKHCAREGYLIGVPEVWKPAPTPPVERWLTRQEAAWLIRGARALNRDGRHLADFILCALYTGSRKASILALHIDQPSIHGGHIDTEQGVLYRAPAGEKETAKRRRPARLPSKYLAHIRRQAKRGRRFVVENHQGNRVADIRKGWSRAVELAETLAAERNIEISLTKADGKKINPHVLKHTAITWALQRGATSWDAAGYFSTSQETIQRVYGHHSPDWQSSAVSAMNRK
ncbi:MAG: integrase [Donghicola eburneus]|nr:integrase [Donghicola eburneus]MCI5042999.1 integrase [Donghicola eburneus]